MKIIVFLGCILSFGTFGQEFNCQVTIIVKNSVPVSTADQVVIDQMKVSIFEFMNNQQWTNDRFKTEERLNCQIQFQITGIPSYGNFLGSMQIQSSRPAFNASYNTTLFNFQDDDIQIAFTGGVPLILPKNGYRDNLSSLLGFYGYFMLGMDYDSFSLKGGTPYFTEAQQIVSNAQSSGIAGWQSNESGSGKRNRYWLVDNVLHQLFEPLRECNYEYHRKGVDMLYENKIAGRKAVTDALAKLNKINATRPNSVNVQNFCRAKLTELQNLYLDAETKEQTDMVNLLKKIDPVNSSKYEQILN
jgi:hypothetical protein